MNCDSTYWDPDSCKCLCTQDACKYTDTARPIDLDPNSLNNRQPGGGLTIKKNDGMGARPYLYGLVFIISLFQ